MRVMVLVPADANSEAGVMPDTDLLEKMGRFNEELVKAGVMLAGEGLHPTSKAARVRFENGKRTVIDGPFTESKELVAGYTIIDVKSREEALAWSKRFPNPSIDGGEGEIEVRQYFDLEDFGESPSVEKARKIGLGQ